MAISVALFECIRIEYEYESDFDRLQLTLEKVTDKRQSTDCKRLSRLQDSRIINIIILWLLLAHVAKMGR